MTKLELLDYTKNNYNSKNRCVVDTISGNDCRYSPKTLGIEDKSKGCAIGCHLTPENALELDTLLTTDDADATSSIHFVMVEEVGKDLLPQWMQGMDTNFLQAVQSMHDNSNNWGDNGLSKQGLEEYERIKQKFINE